MSEPTAPFFDGSQPCAQIGTEAFFPTKGDGPAMAKRICAGCPFREPCLEYALTAKDPHGYPVSGVWGGTSENERRELRKQRRAAA